MVLLAHENIEDVENSLAQLKKLGSHAIKLLESCVAEQFVERQRLSVAASALDNAGFIRVKDHGEYYSPRYTLSPTLEGEEALELSH